jgi:ABC-type Fe3+ transport system permease subunit
MTSNLMTGAVIASSLLLLVVILVLLVRWARRGGKGAVTAGALLSLFAPDPTLERNIRLADEARQQQREEDEEGEGKDNP